MELEGILSFYDKDHSRRIISSFWEAFKDKVSAIIYAFDIFMVESNILFVFSRTTDWNSVSLLLCGLEIQSNVDNSVLYQTMWGKILFKIICLDVKPHKKIKACQN